jgi:hypothetical protein
MCQYLTRKGRQFQSSPFTRPQEMEWYGVYSSPTASSPNYVLKGKYILSLRLLVGYNSIDLSEDVEVFMVLRLS